MPCMSGLWDLPFRLVCKARVIDCELLWEEMPRLDSKCCPVMTVESTVVLRVMF